MNLFHQSMPAIYRLYTDFKTPQSFSNAIYVTGLYFGPRIPIYFAFFQRLVIGAVFHELLFLA